ncbi:hypothetical protein KIL84_001650 [Mauremys mutica]|uniref:Uncharacterized protein n=1 Tax=Mauremys mutica TaxID=74926 RepID=A0A9D3XJ46_9SAUR|nr:hypothetical protein KIL84_001650 [Mauremys mutica]
MPPASGARLRSVLPGRASHRGLCRSGGLNPAGGSSDAAPPGAQGDRPGNSGKGPPGRGCALPWPKPWAGPAQAQGHGAESGARLRDEATFALLSVSGRAHGSLSRCRPAPGSNPSGRGAARERPDWMQPARSSIRLGGRLCCCGSACAVGSPQKGGTAWTWQVPGPSLLPNPPRPRASRGRAHRQLPQGARLRGERRGAPSLGAAGNSAFVRPPGCKCRVCRPAHPPVTMPTLHRQPQRCPDPAGARARDAARLPSGAGSWRRADGTVTELYIGCLYAVHGTAAPVLTHPRPCQGASRARAYK